MIAPPDIPPKSPDPNQWNGRRIIVLSDGTGNSVGKVWRTNVWRLYESLDLSGDTQVAQYDDGVGSSQFLPIAMLGGAFGWGLKRNVIHLYKFVCRNYTKDARLYAFGFSRGAFTVRILVDFIIHRGLIRAENVTESELDRLAHEAYREYRDKAFPDWALSLWGLVRFVRRMNDSIINYLYKLFNTQPEKRGGKDNITELEIEFVGLWDTVAAYGLPIEEMTIGFDKYIWPLTFPNEKPHDNIKRICHALSIDDERTTFHPVLYCEKERRFRDTVTTIISEEEARKGDGRLNPLSDERISQVWFAGVHANVGGGYPDDSLAHVPLKWMRKEAETALLKFKAWPENDPDAERRISSAADKDGRIYDSRAGIGGLYRYLPRDIEKLSKINGRCVEIPKIHFSVLKRIKQFRNAYSPIGLPQKYAVVEDDGSVVLHDFYGPWGETAAQVTERIKHKDRIWNLVWWRRVVYFLTIFAMLYVASFWSWHDRITAAEYESKLRLMAEITRGVESFLPSAATYWTNYFASNTYHFTAALFVLVILLWFGVRHKRLIADEMGSIWRQPSLPPRRKFFDKIAFGVRESDTYKDIMSTLKFKLVPILFAAAFLWIGAGLINRGLFNVLDGWGLYCSETKPAKDLPTVKRWYSRVEGPLPASPCFATGLNVLQGHRYELIIFIPENGHWAERGHSVNLLGVMNSEAGWLHRPLMVLATPFKRAMFRRWYRGIARVGSEGNDEYFLDPPRYTGKKYRFRTHIIPRRSGELFLYVNDAVHFFPLPAFAASNPQWAYATNQGSAIICIKDAPQAPLNLKPEHVEKRPANLLPQPLPTCDDLFFDELPNPGDERR